MGVLLFSIVPRTLGLFLLGACVWRWNLLRGDRRVLAAIAIVGLALGIYATMIGAQWASIVLAFGYGGAIVLAARPLCFLAPLGRMAFTCYLAQSFILSFVFYGWGLGQFGHMTRRTAFCLRSRSTPLRRSRRAVATPLPLRSARVGVAIVQLWKARVAITHDIGAAGASRPRHDVGTEHRQQGQD